MLFVKNQNFLSRTLRKLSTSPKSAHLALSQFSTHGIDETSLPDSIEISHKDAVGMFQSMQTIRTFELKADSLYKNRNIKGFCHLSLGQEACNVGLENSINKDDVVVQSYRMHGIAYMRGHTVKQILGELCGKHCGSSQGKGGSMHYYGDNLYGGYGIVGSQVPIGAGIGWAMKYQKSSKIAVTLFGDGAANQGQVYEAFNMAKLYSCPTIFICENNQYGMGTSAERSSAETNYYTRGQYIPGIRIDGQDLASVLAGTKFAADWCRAGNGPILLEYKTYRFCGHSISDPGLSYRTREEIRDKREHADPIQIFKAKIVDASLVEDSELDEIASRIEDEVEEIAEEVLASEPAKNESLYTNIYSNYTGELSEVRGRSVHETYRV